MVGVLAMAEVEAEDVHPSLDQLADVVDTLDRGAQGSEDLYFFIRRHSSESRESEWRGNR
ncbi:hypothetical protein D3C81_2341890 [compost metagenome]